MCKHIQFLIIYVTALINARNGEKTIFLHKDFLENELMFVGV